MGLFTREKKPPALKRRKSQPKTLREVLNAAFIQELKKNPALLRRVAAKEAGHLDLMEEEDPIEQLKKEKISQAFREDPAFAEQVKQEYLASLNPQTGRGVEDEISAVIDEKAIEMLSKNPQLLQQAVTRRLERLVGKGGSNSGLSQLVEQLDDLDELKERFGGGEGGEKWLNPELVGKAMELVLALVTGNKGEAQGNSKARKVYVVETREGPIELDPVEYKKWLQQRTAIGLPPGEPKLTAPAVPEPSPVSLPAEEPLDQPPAQQSVSLRLTEWLPYVDGNPQEFYQVLMLKKLESHDPNAEYVLTILGTKSADEILALLSPFKSNGGEIGLAIETLEQHKEWMEKLTQIVKENKGEEQKCSIKTQASQ